MDVAVPSTGPRRPPAVAYLIAVLALVVLPAVPASAHAALSGSVPADGDALETPVDEVRLTFNEPVSANAGSLRVFDADAVRVDDGATTASSGTDVAVGLPDDLPAGAYVAVYRVVSADSHPIAGTISFTLGDAQALDADAVAAIAGPDQGAIGAVGSGLRGVGYVGTLLAVGSVIFALLVARGPGDRRRAEDVGRRAALLGVAATLLHLPIQAAAVSGYGVVAALTDATTVGDVLTSGFGYASLARTVALLALAVPWFVVAAAVGPDTTPPPSERPGAVPGRGTRRPLLWLGAAGALALGSYLLDGHQRTVEPAWLLIGGDAIHLAAAATWFGGLVLVAVTLRSTRLEDDPVGGARLIARFSRVATWSVLALVVAGTAMAIPLVRGPAALTSTTYGWLLVAKVGTVAVIVALAALNRRSLVPSIQARTVPAGGSTDEAPATTAVGATDTGAAWSLLIRTVTVEAALIVLVLGLTGFLVTTQPAAEASGLSGPTTVEASLGGGIDLNLSIDPSEAGRNTVHLYAFDETGQLTDRVDPLRLEFTQVEESIGPFVVEPFVAGPGHWTATIDALRFPGPWDVRIVGGLGRFDEVETTLRFEVR